MLRTRIGVSVACLVMTVLWSGCGDSRTARSHVAFVGCPADGMSGPIAPPRGGGKDIALDPVFASQLSYYEGGENGLGVFAPTGWQCRMWYGSSGTDLVITPAAIPEVSSGPSFG